jgi:hypothetical protein
MRTIVDQTFESLSDGYGDWPAVLGDVEFVRCTFTGISIGQYVLGYGTQYPADRKTLKGVVAKDCTAYGRGIAIETAVIDDVTVENLRVGNGALLIRGAVYRHVTIRGACGGLCLTELILISETRKRVERFRAANAAFYENVDWALDISKAEFESCVLDCELPVRLIRRDPETQVIVRRDKVIGMRAAWEASDSPVAQADPKYSLRSALAGLLRSNLAEMVLVVPRRSRRFKERLKALQLLREAGVAEWD